MIDDLKLLTDREVQQFIVTGYTIAQADYTPGFHASIYDQIESVFDAEGNLGNNILPRIPDIGRIFDHPNVKGAITSLLGPGYVLNPHRHCHLNPPGKKGQNWHKDCYVYDHNLRHPRFDWLLAFYYPQETTSDMGPSAILPGTQIYKTISSTRPAETEEEALAICGPAGTVALIHFDSWHRASENVSRKNRYMLKFQFARTAPHAAPAWDHQSRVWSPGISDPQPRVSSDVWDWLCGEETEDTDPPGERVDVLARLLQSDCEPERLRAAYDLAALGEDGIAVLTSTLREQSLATIEETTAQTPDNAHGTNPTPTPAALALSSVGKQAVRPVIQLLGDEDWWVRSVAANVLCRIGTEAKVAIPDLVKASRDAHWWVRRNAIEALTEIGESDVDVTAAVRDGLGDEDYRVRRSACLSVVRFGPAAVQTVADLAPVLEDENRYNRFYAALALRRIGTPEATVLLLDDLFTSRWCPITTKDDRF